MAVSFSIITTTLDRPELLKEAIVSVINQNYDKSLIEHIIIDASSKKTAKDTVEKLSGEVDFAIRYVYMPRVNIPTAINEGIKISTNDVIVILHDDDLLPPEALRHAANRFDEFCQRGVDLDIVCGDVAVIRTNHRTNGFIVERVINLNFSIYDLLFKTPYEPTKFIKRSAFRKIGIFYEKFNYAWHREWLLRAAIMGLSSSHTRTVCYLFRRHTLSTTLPLIWNEYKRLKWLKEHLLMDKNLISLAKKCNNQVAITLLKKHLMRESLSGLRLSIKKAKIQEAAYYAMFPMFVDPALYIKFIQRKFITSQTLI
ncbi:MAG: glycosyltransferase [Nitrososphaerota archaeon]